jgi:hypothetical protein
MRSADWLARLLPGTSVTIWTAALAIGLLPIASAGPRGAGELTQVPSGGPALQPIGAELDGEALRISVPPAWRRLQDGLTLMFAPEDGFGQVAGKTHVVYGVELGLKRIMRQDPSGAFEDVV